MTATTGYIRSFDGARALSIIAVMAYHAGLLHFGWAGVQLFFVLSGYLITTILWKEKFRSESLGYKFKKFWVRRSLRIFPLYFAYLLVLGLTFLVLGFPSYYPTYGPYLWTYTVNYSRLLPEWQGNPLFTHLWSLSIEEQFYLFFPFIIFLMKPSIIRRLLLALILLAPLIRYGLGLYYAQKAEPLVAADAVYWNLLTHLDAFFIGALIPVFRLQETIVRPQRVFAFALCLALVGGGVNYYFNDGPHAFLTDLGYDHDQVGNYAHVWRYTLLNFLFASLILVLVSPHAKGLKGLERLLAASWLVRIGRVSYGMYIFHWAILVYGFERIFGHSDANSRWLWFPLYVAAVYLVAELSYRFFEAKFLVLKDRFFPAKEVRKEPAKLV
jgi:peptidoglycan/LPS O-acetylase OafA/YrhL